MTKTYNVYHWLNGYYDLLAGNIEQGAQHFQILADRGDAGVGYYGNATLLPWLFEGDDRLDMIHRKFVENQQTQVEQLWRMRNSGLTLEQVRAQYIGSGGQRQAQENMPTGPRDAGDNSFDLQSYFVA